LIDLRLARFRVRG